jgi:hypothetical protein
LLSDAPTAAVETLTPGDVASRVYR